MDVMSIIKIHMVKQHYSMLPDMDNSKFVNC